METTIKTIYNFDDEEDISYIKVTHKFPTNDELVEAINEVNTALADDDNEDGESIYGNIGHNIDTLMDYMTEKYDISYEMIVAFTVTSRNCIITEPDYNREIQLW